MSDAVLKPKADVRSEEPTPKPGEMTDGRHKWWDTVIKSVGATVALLGAGVGLFTLIFTFTNNEAARHSDFLNLQTTIEHNAQTHKESLRNFAAEQEKDRRNFGHQLETERNAQAEQLRKEREQRQKEFLAEQKAREAEFKKELATRDLEYRKPLYVEQLAIYKDACKSAATIASSSDTLERGKAYQRFWQLYFGELAMIEDNKVSSCMIEYANLLFSYQKKSGMQSTKLPAPSVMDPKRVKKGQTPPLPTSTMPEFSPQQRAELQRASLALAYACRAELKDAWKVRLGTFRRTVSNP